MNTDQILIKAIEQFDKEDIPGFSEYEVSSKLKKEITKEQLDKEIKLQAEIFAFDFCENYQDKKTGWGTYFGPMMVWKNDDGTVSEYPSIQKITLEIIKYWAKRTVESSNAVLKARYSGLVWEFSKQITNNAPSFEIGKLYIESLLRIAEKRLHKYEVDTIEKLKRAIGLSISFNSAELIEKSKEMILEYENKISEDTKPGLWGFSYDLLIENKKIKLDAETENKIIEELEAKLNRLSSTKTEKSDPWALEAAAERLARYYRKKHKNEDVRRVILQVGKSFEDLISKASAFEASGWLEHIHNLYTQYGLNDEARDVLIRLRKLGSKVNDELKTFSHSLELPKEKIEEYINAMLDGDLETVLTRIALHHIPNRSEVERRLFEIAKKAPLQFLMTHKIQDRKGRIIATVSPIETDLDGHVTRQIEQDLAMGYFLRLEIHEGNKKFDTKPQDLINFIDKAKVIENDRLELIYRGILAYFKADYVISIHLIVPQIEQAIRNILELSGGNVLKPSKSGGFNLRTFDELLRDDIILKSLGDDLCLYFRVLFTDQRGWNLRNDLCHGMMEPNQFNISVADRVLHALLCLGLLRSKQVVRA